MLYPWKQTISQFLNKKKKNTANKNPSKRSKKPPWPGKISPESFTRAMRLSHDSNKSPKSPSRQMMSVNPMMNHHGLIASISHMTHNTPIHAKRYPPINPSQLLCGLTEGMIKCLPIKLPTRYDPVSKLEMIIKSIKSRLRYSV